MSVVTKYPNNFSHQDFYPTIIFFGNSAGNIKISTGRLNKQNVVFKISFVETPCMCKEYRKSSPLERAFLKASCIYCALRQLKQKNILVYNIFFVQLRHILKISRHL